MVSIEQFVATVLGAFLASIFGIASSILIWHYQKKKEQNVIIKMLYSELKDLKVSLQRFQDGIDQKILKPGIRVRIKFLKYNTYSIERQNLYRFMTKEEISALESVYNTFQEYDELLAEAPRQIEGDPFDYIMVFWGYYQAQQQNNIRNINQCLQYLEKKI